jgi:hypothetical protein
MFDTITSEQAAPATASPPTAASPTSAPATHPQVGLAALEAQICELAGHLTAGTCRWLGLIAEFDRREGWAGPGLRSCAQWLSWKCGLGMVAAREHLRVAHALSRLPLVRAAFAAGRLSYSKVRALTRIATPATEADLVMMAGHATAAQIERLARGYRQARSADATNERHDARFLTWRQDHDGSLLVTARLAPEQGALFLAAVAATRAATEDPTRNLEEGPAPTEVPGPADAAAAAGDERPPYGPDPNGALRAKRANADALVAMAETVLACGPTRMRGDERYQVIVHADLTTLADLAREHPHAGTDDRDPATATSTPTPTGTAAEQGARCGHLHDGADLHPDTLRRLSCDATLIPLIHGAGGSLLNAGRRTRAIRGALRRALFARDGGCRFPGCTQRRGVDGHHIRHWARGGETSLTNLVLLCRHHHRLLHEGGYRITVSGPGAFVFHRPDGTPIPEHPEPVPLPDDVTIEARHGAHITPETAVPRCNGDPLRLGYAVAGLLAAENHYARRAHAESN